MLAGKLKATVSPRLPDMPEAAKVPHGCLITSGGWILMALWHTKVILGLSKFQGDPCHDGCTNNPGNLHHCICLAVLGRKLKQQVGVKLAESQGRYLKSQSSFVSLPAEDLVWKRWPLTKLCKFNQASRVPTYQGDLTL